MSLHSVSRKEYFVKMKHMNDIRTKIGEGGRVIIPTLFRQAMHLNAGDDIILHIEDNEIHITTPEQALLKLQAKVRSYLDKTEEAVSLVDELISSRRSEANHEQ
jgi:AbrB family looped-hinge helix DNA binding protein